MSVQMGIRSGKAGRRSLGLLVLLALVAVLSPAIAQEPSETEEPLTTDVVEKRRSAAEQDKNLSDSQREQILDAYDKAGQSLKSESDRRALERRYERDQRNVGREVSALQRELDRPTAEPQVNLEDDATVEEVERRLVQERAELEARRQALSDLEKMAEDRANRRSEIARRIGTLNQQIEDSGDQLRSLSEQDAIPELRIAVQAQLRANIADANQEIATLRAEQVLLDSRAELLPLRRDRSQRRVAESERLVAMLTTWADRSKRAEAEESLEAVRKICSEAVEQHPVLQELSDETSSLAEVLWGEEEGVAAAAEEAARTVTTTSGHSAEILKIANMTRRKFEAVRSQGIAAQWWPKIPEDLPQPAELRRAIRQREQLLPNVQHELIVLQEKRVEEGNIEREVKRYADRATQVDPGADAAAVERTVRQLVTTRRDLLDRLIRSYTRYSDQLFELSAASQELLARITGLDDYIMQRVLWVRSVPGPKIPPFVDVAGGFRWLFLNRDWGAILTTSLSTFYQDFWLIFLILLVAPLFILRRRLRSALENEADRASSQLTDSFNSTLRALGLTILLAAPVPLLLLLMSRFFSPHGDPGPLASGFQLGESELARALSVGSIYLAGFIGAFALLIETLRERGLGEAHFGWNPSTTGPSRKILLRFVVLATPFALVALPLAAEGLRFHSQPDLRAYSNGLGRLSFILGVLILATMTNRILRPQGPIMRAAYEGQAESWTGKMRYIWYPALLVLILAPAVLAASSYYITGFVLMTQLIATLALTVVVALIEELLVRWRDSKDVLPSPEAYPRITTSSDIGARSGMVNDLVQVRQTARFTLGLVWLVAFLFIWSDVLPSLQVLTRVQIWPQVRLMEIVTDGASPPSVPPPEQASPSESVQPPSEGATTTPLMPGGPAPATPGATGQDQASGVLTLAALLDALLVLVLTIILSKNLPRLINFAVLLRMPMNSGARTATSKLVQYFVTMVGISVAARVVGLTWQSIQWLAAALTFGLGFGLQEIFANFISGLIILLDRPIRVGDVVTIGDIGGWVTKISIRATTITKWDRSELIVPNKEFITGQLVNWTLSDSLTRVELKIGVEYGTDVEKVRTILREVADNHPAVLKEPAPYVVLMEFGDSAVNFELRVYLNYEYGRLTIRDELHRRVVAAFEENGIVIAFPQLDLHVKRELQEALPPTAETAPPPGATPRGLQDADD